MATNAIPGPEADGITGPAPEVSVLDLIAAGARGATDAHNDLFVYGPDAMSVPDDLLQAIDHLTQARNLLIGRPVEVGDVAAEVSE